ncbi:RICIN domain-containing protein [Streptomyces sp. NPDC059906]
MRGSTGAKPLAVRDGSTAVGAFVVQDADDGTADHRWRILH